MSDDVTEAPPPKSANTVEDIILWRRKKLAFSILIVETATWVLLNVYGFNSMTIVSWAAIAAVALLFLWGNLLRLLHKGEPELSRLRVSEDFAAETASTCRELGEEAIRWMFSVSSEREWFVFARTVLGLWILSRVGNLLDFQTFLFIGSVMGLTVPVFWEKQKGRIKKISDRLKEKTREAYSVAREKIVTRKGKKASAEEKKEKKTE
ncbi:PREDICTED: reticulon-like protein B13 [Tarenaya hassleriana]|uniref:reticulon-like protein B13 n=1 Tax=Tarenaya hassleriana TaxID=28532 RepID=UPI00053C1829|nr:PREDICTED: reticulon-like protein B13 [Tarenaya hassleriana]